MIDWSCEYEEYDCACVCSLVPSLHWLRSFFQPRCLVLHFLVSPAFFVTPVLESEMCSPPVLQHGYRVTLPCHFTWLAASPQHVVYVAAARFSVDHLTYLLYVCVCVQLLCGPDRSERTAYRRGSEKVPVVLQNAGKTDVLLTYWLYSWVTFLAD